MFGSPYQKTPPWAKRVALRRLGAMFGSPCRRKTLTSLLTRRPRSPAPLPRHFSPTLGIPRFRARSRALQRLAPAPRSPSPLPSPAYTAPHPHIPSHRRSFAALASHLSPTPGIPSNRLAYLGSQQACSALRRPFAERRAGVLFRLMNPRTPASPCASVRSHLRFACNDVTA